MAADIIQITCVGKRDKGNPHERIAFVGGTHNGKPWKLKEDSAITGIEDGKYSFYVRVENRRAWVVVAVHNGRRYMKAGQDEIVPAILLALPECP